MLKIYLILHYSVKENTVSNKLGFLKLFFLALFIYVMQEKGSWSTVAIFDSFLFASSLHLHQMSAWLTFVLISCLSVVHVNMFWIWSVTFLSASMMGTSCIFRYLIDEYSHNGQYTRFEAKFCFSHVNAAVFFCCFYV